MKKVNIALKNKIHLQAKVISVIKGINLSEYLEKAIEEAIKKDKKLIEDIYFEDSDSDKDKKEGGKK